MELRILGPLAAEEDGRPIVLGGPRPRALLAILVLNRGEVVPADTLIERLYGGQPPRGAAKTLQTHVSRLRKALGSGAELRTTSGGYTLDLEPGTLDLDRFDVLVTQGRAALARNDASAASATLGEALALWRGPPLADFRFEEFAQSDISRLEERRLAAVEDRIDAELELGRHGDTIPELEALVREHPLRERLRRQLMLALYRSGRQAEALDVYADARRALTEELGLEPTDELKQLQRAILAHDPALSPPSPDKSPRLEATTDFVGRSGERETLSALLGDALVGRGRLALISGEPGIGKSRLADELIGHAGRHGARVLIGRCWEAGGAPAYWPWIQSLRTYIRDCEPDLLRQQLGPGAPDLAQLFPELHELIPDLPVPPSIESEGARFRLFDATTSFLKAAAHAQPLVLVFDDLHAGDEPSLLLLQFLARELGDSRLLVLALYRDVDPSLREPLTTALAELTREPVTRRLPLTGFAATEVAEFVERATDSTPSGALVTAIYDETDGNPLFVGEIVRLLAAEGRLDAAGAQLEIPQGVRDVIERRVRRLGDEPANLLTLASVLGREFEPDVLARFSGRSSEDTLLLLDEAIAERIVGEVPGARDRLRFAHELIRDTLYDGLRTRRRFLLHRQAGESLEQVYAENPDPHLAELAHHFTAAAPGGDVGKAIDYSRRAAERASALLAYEEAVRLYEWALELSATEDVSRCELLLALGDAQARAGDTPESNATFRAAAELADRLELPDQLARAALGYGGRIAWDVSRDDSYAAELLERGLAAIGDEPTAMRVRLLSRLAAGPLRDARFPSTRKVEVSREALETARMLGDPSTLAYALVAYTQAILSPDKADERLERAGELVEVAMAAGEKERAFEGHEERLLTLVSIGDRSGAEAELVAIEKLAQELRQPAHQWLMSVHRAWLALLDGRLAEADVLVMQARSFGERAQSWSSAVSYGLQLFLLRREQGRLTEVEDLIRSSADLYPTYPIWRCVLAETAAELGNVADARSMLDELAANDFGRIPFDEEWLVSLTLLAEAATLLGDSQKASTIFRLLQPWGHRVAVSYPEISTGSVARYLGLLATTLERWEDAERSFGIALAMNEQIHARSWVARTQHDYARMLRERGLPRDAERADEVQRAARETANEIGMSLT
jgi:DNA-binding SARP family transcriptional activator